MCLNLRESIVLRDSFRGLMSSHGVSGLSVQVGLHGRDELALLLQCQVQIILLVMGDVLEDLVHQLAVL